MTEDDKIKIVKTSDGTSSYWVALEISVFLKQ